MTNELNDINNTQSEINTNDDLSYELDTVNEDNFSEKEIEIDLEKDDLKIDSNVSDDFFSKCKKFAKKNIDYLITAGTIISLFLISLIVNGNMPFGNNRTALVSDTYEQVAIFFNHFFDLFEGKATLFYSNYYARGIEIFSTIEYMYLNPFYIIALLGGRKNIFVMMTFSIIFMFVFIGLIFIWFSKKYFKNVEIQYRILFALLYVFSGYINYNYSFSTWIIYPALLLIVVDRFLNFMKTGKMTSFICCLVWYVITCYSVGISTIIILVILMISYIFYFVEKQDRAKKFTDLFVVLSITALISLIILFPSIISLFNTSRSNSFIKNLVDKKDANIIPKLGIVFFDSIILIFSLIYFIKCDKKSKINKFLFFMLIVFYIPVFFDSVIKILCFSSYQGFSGRFYFFNETLLFCIAMSLFDNKIVNYKECESKMLSKVLVIFMLILFVVIAFCLVLFNYIGIGECILSPLYKGSNLTKIFASMFAIELFIIVIIYLLNIRNLFNEKNIKLVINFMLIVSILFNYTVFVSRTFQERDSDIEKLISSNNINENIKILNCQFDYNVYNFRYDETRSLSVFSSLLPSEVINSYKSLGYLVGSTCTYLDGNTLIADSIFGYKNYLVNKEISRPYLDLIDNSGEYYIYKNNLSTNGTFILNSSFSFDKDKNNIENFTKLKDFFGIDEDLYREVSIKQIKKYEEDGLKSATYEYTADADGILYLDKYSYRISENKSKVEKFYVERYSSYSDLNYIKNGETYKFVLTDIDNVDLDNVKAYFLNYEVAKEFCEKLGAKQDQIKFKYNKDGYEVNFSINSDEKLYIMVPNIQGLHYYLNGEEIEVETVFGDMVILSSSVTSNTLVVKYQYPHLIKWIAFIVFAIIMIATIILIYHFTKFKHIQNIIKYSMYVLVVSLFTIIYAVGIFISIIWFFV